MIPSFVTWTVRSKYSWASDEAVTIDVGGFPFPRDNPGEGEMT